MEKRTKKIFSWFSICVGTLLLGFPLEGVVNGELSGLKIIIGLLGFVIMINGVRFLQRIDNPWKPKSAKPKKKLRRKHR